MINFFYISVFIFTIISAYADNGAFLAGMATTVAVHESGHLLTAASLGYKVKIKGASITYIGNMSDRDHLRLASAGFQTQWILTESIFCANENKKMSDYERGIIAGHIAITAAYLTILMNHPESDTRGIKDSAQINNLTTAAIIAVPAALDYWRVFGKNSPKWVPLVSSGCKYVGIAAVWSY
ncbi:MAG: hypothetical protein WCO98_12655 [bacterium]